MGAVGIRQLHSSRTLYVDSTYGSDATGRRGRADRPYATTAAAAAAALPWDVVHWRSGEHWITTNVARSFAYTISAASRDEWTEVTITAAGHPFVVGSIVRIQGITGCTYPFDGQYRVHAVDGNTFKYYQGNASEIPETPTVTGAKAFAPITFYAEPGAVISSDSPDEPGVGFFDDSEYGLNAPMWVRVRGSGLFLSGSDCPSPRARLTKAYSFLDMEIAEQEFQHAYAFIDVSNATADVRLVVGRSLNRNHELLNATAIRNLYLRCGEAFCGADGGAVIANDVTGVAYIEVDRIGPSYGAANIGQGSIILSTADGSAGQIYCKLGLVEGGLDVLWNPTGRVTVDFREIRRSTNDVGNEPVVRLPSLSGDTRLMNGVIRAAGAESCLNQSQAGSTVKLQNVLLLAAAATNSITGAGTVVCLGSRANKASTGVTVVGDALGVSTSYS